MKAAAVFAVGFVIAMAVSAPVGIVLMVVGFGLWLTTEAHANDE